MQLPLIVSFYVISHDLFVHRVHMLMGEQGIKRVAACALFMVEYVTKILNIIKTRPISKTDNFCIVIFNACIRCEEEDVRQTDSGLKKQPSFVFLTANIHNK